MRREKGEGGGTGQERGGCSPHSTPRLGGIRNYTMFACGDNGALKTIEPKVTASQ